MQRIFVMRHNGCERSQRQGNREEIAFEAHQARSARRLNSP
jgi:hypothetical protein